MKQLWKAGLVVIALLALGGAAAGIVAAQSSDETPTPAATAIADATAVDDGTATSQPTDEDATATPESKDGTTTPDATTVPDNGEANDDSMASGCPGGHLRANLDDLAAFLNLSVEDLRAQLMDGQSLAQVAEAQGVSRDALTAHLVDETKTRLDEKVASGDIDQARADELLQHFTDHVEDLVDRTGPPFGGHGHSGDLLSTSPDTTESSSLTF